MTVQGQLKAMLVAVAEALGEELRARLVFVGGCTTALYITDPIVLEGVRATDDVDLIVDLAGFAEWAELMERLRARGFTEAADDSVICRMKLGELKVDFMPDDEAILGFSNRWYAKGIETAVPEQLEEALEIRRLTPSCLSRPSWRHIADAAKAISSAAAMPRTFSSGRRAGGDRRGNRERRAGDPGLHRRTDCGAAHDPNFDHFLEGNIRGPAGRADIVYERLVAISRLDTR
jgi:hypothetical protein